MNVLKKSYRYLPNIIDTLSDPQKRAIRLFGTTGNKYRYRDKEGLYGEPFLWQDCKWTVESAPWNVLDSLAFPDKNLLKHFYSKYSGDYYFLTDLGKEVLGVLKVNTNIQDYIKSVKRDSRPPGGLTVF